MIVVCKHKDKCDEDAVVCYHMKSHKYEKSCKIDCPYMKLKGIQGETCIPTGENFVMTSWYESSDIIKIKFECQFHGEFVNVFNKNEITDVLKIPARCSECEKGFITPEEMLL